MNEGQPSRSGPRLPPQRFIRIGALVVLVVGLVGLVVVLVSPSTGGEVVQQGNLVAPGGPDEALRLSLDEKAAMESRRLEALQAGAQKRAGKDAQTSPGLPLVQDPAFRTGIIEGEPGPFYSGEMLVANLWQEVLEGRFVQVYAGALGEDPDQGVVVVLTLAQDKSQGTEDWYPTPDRQGAVRVVEARGSQLVLQAASGARYLFDVASRQYLTFP